MSGSDPNLDETLRAYLQAWQWDQQHGHTLANLRLEIHQLKERLDEVTNENTLLRGRVDRQGRRIQVIEKHLALESDDTGQHQVEDLRRLLAKQEKELEERKEEGRWWRRSAVKWIAASAAWLLVTVLTILGMLALPSITKGGSK